VREPYAQLLQDAGVDTVKEPEIPQSRTPRGGDECGQLQAQRVRLLPSQKRVAAWIEAAKKLDQKIKY